MMTSNLRILLGKLAAPLALALLLAPIASDAGAAGDAAAGKTTFVANCASCHGEGGKGDGPVGAAIEPKPRDFTVGEFKFDTDKSGDTGTDADLTNVIRKGGAAFGGSPLMAPWPHLSDEEVANLIAYIRSLK